MYTILVNKNNPIKENYINRVSLVSTKDIEDEDIQVEEKAYQAYLELKKRLEQERIDIGIESAYRSIEKQKEVYQEILDEKGLEYTKKYVADPYTSEHHTGLAIDIALLPKIKIDENTEEKVLEDRKEKWSIIHKLLPEYGFILRYPKGKEEITGYSYECWHIRYVGKFPAKIMTENQLTLEEYLSSYGCVIAVNKEKGCTSFDVVNEISHLFGIKKVGHTGTLDPMATGVLLVAVGKATKIIELITAYDKEYIATAELGINTDTYDNTGTVLEQMEVPNDLPIEEIVNSYQKTYLQEVPIYSAVKVNGKKLYDYARSNKKVELPKKEVTIKEIELLEKTSNTFKIKAHVTKGCYIRSLIHDIGLSLNNAAIMTSLTRTRQGNVAIENTNTLEEIKKGEYTSLSIEDVLKYPVIKVEEDLEFKIKNGVKIPNNWNIKDKVIIKNKQNSILGIYEVENQKLKVWKNFN